MDSLGRVIGKILKQNPSLKRGVEDAKILEAWGPAVGDLIAKHSKAVQVREKTLIIEVDHPIWKQELTANKALALKKLNQKISEVLNDQREQPWIEDLFFNNLRQTKHKASPKSGK